MPMPWTALPERPRVVQTLERETNVPASIDEAFAFFSNAVNLERLTPPWLNFEILTPPPIVMRAGLEIDYRIRLYGVPIPWRSLIEIWEPGVRFVDRQIAGPYRWWRHLHAFERAGATTRVVDRVEYAPRAAWISSRFVQRDVERIFAYRQEKLRELFAHVTLRPPATPAPGESS